MKKKFVVCFLFLLQTIGLSAAETKKPSLEVIASWEIQAGDLRNQRFVLKQELFDGLPMYSLSFYNGQRELRNSLVEDNKWKKWREQWSVLASSASGPSTCPHPLKFETRNKNSEVKSKHICTSQMSKIQHEGLVKLLEGFKGYLYER